MAKPKLLPSLANAGAILPNTKKGMAAYQKTPILKPKQVQKSTSRGR